MLVPFERGKNTILAKSHIHIFGFVVALCQIVCGVDTVLRVVVFAELTEVTLPAARSSFVIFLGIYSFGSYVRQRVFFRRRYVRYGCRPERFGVVYIRGNVVFVDI